MKKRKEKKLFVLGGAIIGVAVIVTVVIGVFVSKRTVPRLPESNTPVIKEAPKMMRRLIDGIMVEPGKETPPLAGAMVENMIDAQPL